MTKPVHQFDRLPGTQKSSQPDTGSGRNVADMISGSAERPDGEPLVGLVYNSHSHRNRGQDLVEADRPGVLIARAETRDDLPAVMEHFAKAGVEYLVFNGGDGTVRDALTAGLPFFGENWPVMAVLPKGKTNALNVDLGAPADWSLSDAIAAYHGEGRIKRKPVAISDLSAEPSAVNSALLGFIIGGGAIATGVEVGQKAHKMGAFNSFAVIMTGTWGVLQAVFGSDTNVWRRGVDMTFRLGEDGAPLPRSKHGNPARRGMLLATTLDRMPMGIKPFGQHKGGIRLAVMDKPRRRMMALFGPIMAGYAPEWLPEAGYHQLTTEKLELDIGDSFILDGEAFPAGSYLVEQGPELTFVVP